MIIGLTIRDNDYHGFMKAFCDTLASGKLIMEKPPGPDDPNRTAWYEHYRTVMHTAFPALTEHTSNANEDVKQMLIDAIQSSWRHTVQKVPRADGEYLQNRLEVTLQDSITDRWENGEKFYILISSTTDKVLCF